jgi:hypothetical protein
MIETPQISSSCYASSTTAIEHSWGGLQASRQIDSFNALQQYQEPQQKKESKIMADKTTRRIVQVFIADPNDNVPLEKSVLYTGEQKLTDLNDTELFFEVPNLQDLIRSHNETRKVTADKEASKRAGKDIFLDPVKIRDLKMVVVTVASF